MCLMIMIIKVMIIIMIIIIMIMMIIIMIIIMITMMIMMIIIMMMTIAIHTIDVGGFILLIIIIIILYTFQGSLLGDQPNLSEMEEILKKTNYNKLKFIKKKSYNMNCNWKVFIDNYLGNLLQKRSFTYFTTANYHIFFLFILLSTFFLHIF